MYLRKIAGSCEEFGSISICLCPNYIKFWFKNLKNCREDKSGGRKTFFGINQENKNSDIFC